MAYAALLWRSTRNVNHIAAALAFTRHSCRRTRHGRQRSAFLAYHYYRHIASPRSDLVILLLNTYFSLCLLSTHIRGRCVICEGCVTRNAGGVDYAPIASQWDDQEPVRVIAGLRQRDVWHPSSSDDDGVPDADGTPRSRAAEGGKKHAAPQGGPEMPRLLCCRISLTHYSESDRSYAAHWGHFSPIPIPAITRTGAWAMESVVPQAPCP